MAVADRVYRGLLSAVGFFSKGWGPVETYQSLLSARPQMHDRASCSDIVTGNSHPVSVKEVRSSLDCVVYDGRFRSPLATFLPGVLPRESEIARFELILPQAWRSSSRPVYIHLAGTGDHYFWRRRNLTALPLLKDSHIGSLLLENPFYGYRKPRQQLRSQLHYVSDLFVMGLALILECQRLLYWLEEEGLGPVGLTGISMGGHNASLAACLWPKPVAVVPCLSWSTASCVFTEGILSSAVSWDILEEQLFNSRIGHDEQRRDIFHEMMRRGCEEACDWWAGGEAHRADVSLDNLKVKREGLGASLNSAPGDESAEMKMTAISSPEQSWFGSDEEDRLEHFIPQELLQGRQIRIIPRIPPATMLRELDPRKGGKGGERRKRRRRKFDPNCETVTTMRQILDLATHLCYYPSPLAPENALFIAAKDDLYIPRKTVTDVHHLWPGCDVRYVEGGHVSSTILKQTEFRRALSDTMDRLTLSQAVQS